MDSRKIHEQAESGALLRLWLISACPGIESWTLRGLMDFGWRCRQPTDATTVRNPEPDV